MDWASWTTVGVVAGSGGVRTDERGSMTGGLDIHTTWADGQAVVTVQYSGATEWFTVTGSPVPCSSETESRNLHQAMVEAARTGQGATLNDLPPL